MTVHKHVEMITAKANNMDLVRFIKADLEWAVQVDAVHNSTLFNQYFEYFLCLPQHKEAALNILNGGISQVTCDSNWNDPSTINDIGDWRNGNDVWYMSQYCQSRIKPKKEKRLIVIHDGRVIDYLYKNDSDIRMSYGSKYDSLQIIEAEVEV